MSVTTNEPTKSTNTESKSITNISLANQTIYGYLRREHESTIPIPVDIQNIIYSFAEYFFKYHGNYTWTLNNSQLQEIKSFSPENKTKNITINSPKFMLSDLEFEIRIFPKKISKSQCYDLRIALILLSTEYNATVSKKLYCPELELSCTNLGVQKNQSAFGWTKQLLTQDKLLYDYEHAQLTFVLDIKILKLVCSNNSKNENKIKYEHINYFPMSINQPLTYSWKISKGMMKNIHRAYPGNTYESALINNMWRLRVTPNGCKKHWKDAFDVYLVLCLLPKGVRKVEVEWEIQCLEIGINTERQSVLNLDRACYDCWCRKRKQFSFKELQNYDEITIDLDLNAVKYYDDNGDVIEMIED